MARNAIQRLRETPGKVKQLDRKTMTLTDATAGERSLVASYKARGVPFAIRDGAAARLAFVTAEEFTTNTTADDAETFSLSYNLVDTVNTQNLILYDSGTRVQPDSVDVAANEFTYTNPDAAADTLHAFYVARDPGAVTIEKVAPKTASQLSETLDEDTTSGLADRNQNKDPVKFEFHKPLEGVVPANWELRIYVDAPAPVRWDDSSLATSNGDVATSAIIELPIVQFEQTVPGLAEAVKRDALGIEGR
jgi:hypothetical protein